MTDVPPKPGNLAPRVADGATPTECVAMWIDLMNSCERLLLAGLRHEIGPEGDLREAHLRWHRERAEEHRRDLQQFARRLDAAIGGGHGR